MKKVFFLILLLSLNCLGQSISRITSRCPNPNRSISSSVSIQTDGNIIYTPCPNTTNFFPTQIKLSEFNYAPFLSTNPFLVIGNTTPINTSSNFFNFDSDMKLNLSGNGKIAFNTFFRTSLGGNYTGGTVGGLFNSTDNLQYTGASGFIYGIFNFLNVERTTTTAVGLYTETQAGGSGASGITDLIGAQLGVIAGHNGAQTNATSIDAFFDTPDSGAAGSVTNAKMIRVKLTNRVLNTLTEFHGLSFDNWTNTGIVTNNSVIFADASVDVGNTTNYFINSASVSPSKFAGDISFTNNAKGIILRSPDNTCHLIAVSNANALSASTVTCP